MVLKQKGERGMKKLLVLLSLLFTTVSYADTETINWYVGNDSYAQTTCETGTDIILPTTPTKRGHTFDGWVVPLYDFSTLDYTKNGTSFTKDNASFSWSTLFPYGTISGEALCSVTEGTIYKTGNPDENTSGGQYCWCKATGYRPNGINVIHNPWVFHHDAHTSNDCISWCTENCGGFYIMKEPFYRKALFGITQ